MKHRGIRWLALVAVIALLCGVMPATYALSTPQMAEIPNLLENGDFELGNTTGWVRNAYAIDVTEEAAKDGKFGAKITSGGGEWDEYQGLYADIQVEKNTDYVFSFDHKSDAAACVIVYIFTPERERYFVSSWPTQVPGCWSKQQYYFNSGDYDVIRVQMCVGAKNTVRYFDNICLSPVTKNAIGGGLASVMDTQDNRKGVAFRFDVAAQVKVEEPNAFVSGTIDPYGTGAQYELVRMGAVVTNKAMDTEELTLEAVDGKRCIDIAAKNVLEVTADTVSYAVRVTNVPEYAENQFISARPYCIYRDGASEYVLYSSAAYTESCNSITTRHESAVFTPGDEWKLIWNDEFGGTAVDETKWYGELMVDDGNYYATNREENLSVRDGNMVLTVLDEPIGNSRFTGSRVNTGHNFSFLYGRLEFRAKLSWGKGVASALWTLGDYYLYNGVGNGWPYGGEIDIMELVGDSNTDPFSKENMTTTHNIHWGYDYSQHYEVGSYKLGGYNNCYKFPDGISPSGEYHIYAVEWDYRQFKFYVDDVFQMEIRWGTDSDGWDYLAWYDQDGKQLGKVFRLPAFDDNGNYIYTDVSCADLDFAFANEENPHFLIMNNLMCGWNANQDTNGGNLPQSMYVDYVRVYQKVKDELAMIKAVVFDLDDTLVDSWSRFDGGMLPILEQAGIPYDREEMIKKMHPQGVPPTAALFCEMGVPGTVEEVTARITESMRREYAHRIFLLPGVKDYLSRLRAHNIPMYTLTASPHHITDPCLKNNGVYDWFTTVWTVEDYGLTKSQPELFLRVVEAVGVAPEEILYIDDSPTAIKNAAAAGMQVCGVLCPYTPENAARIPTVTDRYISSFEELTEE